MVVASSICSVDEMTQVGRHDDDYGDSVGFGAITSCEAVRLGLVFRLLSERWGLALRVRVVAM